MRDFLIHLLGGVTKKDLLEYRPTKGKEELLYTIVGIARNESLKEHPEYRNSTIDKFFFSSFAKRFITRWNLAIMEGKHKEYQERRQRTSEKINLKVLEGKYRIK